MVEEAKLLLELIEEKNDSRTTDYETQCKRLMINFQKLIGMFQCYMYTYTRYGRRHQHGYISGTIYNSFHETSELYDYGNPSWRTSKNRANFCSQPFCNRTLAHPPVYRRYEDMDIDICYFHHDLLKYECDCSPVNKDASLEDKIKIQQNISQQFIAREKVKNNNFYFFAMKCTIWWKCLINRWGDTKIYLDDGSKTQAWINFNVNYDPVIKDKILIHTIPNRLNTCIKKNNTCLCQICIIDTLFCHCTSCVRKEFLFKNYPSIQCVHLKIWEKKIVEFLSNLKNICCCQLHFCLYNNNVCYCRKCTFRIEGCVCIRCMAFDVIEEKSECKHKHCQESEKCREEIVSNWLDFSYHELFKKFYPTESDSTTVSLYSLHDLQKNEVKLDLLSRLHMRHV